LDKFLSNAFKIAEKVAAIIKIEIINSRLNMRAIITHVNLVLSVI